MLVPSYDGPLYRFTAVGGLLGAWGGPGAWAVDEDGGEWPGSMRDHGYLGAPLGADEVWGAASSPDGTVYAVTEAGIVRMRPADER